MIKGHRPLDTRTRQAVDTICTISRTHPQRALDSTVVNAHSEHPLLTIVDALP